MHYSKLSALLGATIALAVLLVMADQAQSGSQRSLSPLLLNPFRPIYSVPVLSPGNSPVVDTCAGQNPGDVNGDGVIDITDALFLQNFLMWGTPPSPVLANADVNGDCRINIGDFLCLVQYQDGMPPCAVTCTCVNPDLTHCCYGERGNVDSDWHDQVDISDLIYLIDYSFGDGLPPACFDEADVNGDLSIDVGDIVYLQDYMFGDPPGPAPMSCP